MRPGRLRTPIHLSLALPVYLIERCLPPRYPIRSWHRRMNRSDLQRLAELRIAEAKVLLENNCWAGAYYLAGYAVECALKACIAKTTQQYDFPDRGRVNSSHTHNLSALARIAGLEEKFRERAGSEESFNINWKSVRDWSEEVRYRPNVPEHRAVTLYGAIVDAEYGVLPCIKKFW